MSSFLALFLIFPSMQFYTNQSFITIKEGLGVDVGSKFVERGWVGG